MGFMNKFKGFMGIPEDEYDDDEDLDYDKDFDDDLDEEDVTGFGTQSRRSAPAPAPVPPPAPSFSIPVPEPEPVSKVVSIHSNSQYQVVVVKPERFEDASGIADHLIAKRAVLLNLEAATPDLKRRLVDFLSGVAYTNGGQIKPVANSTYIITPCNVNVMGESMIDELGSHGVYF
ncbi:MAG: cell division protein SepF [Angelakisella sp.]|jgi:cell division inhibitor SepF|nr:cell division protein SepF [Angelakisella sp.]